MDNQERFFKWLLSMGNIHTADSVRMTKAYKAIADNDLRIKV